MRCCCRSRYSYGIRKEQDLLALNEEGLGNGYYWFAVFGEPGEGRWAWRFGGHHISIHITYDGNRITSLTPLHLGGEMEAQPPAGWDGYKIFDSETGSPAR